MNMANDIRRKAAEMTLLGTDDVFRFRCTACGKCCKNREDILLSPYDLNRISKLLGIEMGQVIQDYCIWYPGESSMLPVVAMKMIDSEKRCPFLKNRKCKIHTAKPTVCALFPLGRIGTEDAKTVRYMLQHTDCGVSDEEHTVREWLAGYDMENSEAWFLEWQKVLLPLSERMHKLFSGFSKELIATAVEGLLVALYVNYEPDQDFMEQFRRNAVKASEYLDSMENLMKMYGRL